MILLKIWFSFLILFMQNNDALNTNETCKLGIEIKGLRNDKGSLMLAIYNSADGFPDDKNKIYMNKIIQLKNADLANLTLDLPAKGSYAIAIIHDENENQKLDTNFFGVPTEGYGFSNNKTGMFGPPSFKDSSFSLLGKTKDKIQINVKYW